MKKRIILLFIIVPFFAFSQGEEKTAIDWLPLNKAEKFAKDLREKFEGDPEYVINYLFMVAKEL